MNPGPHLCRFVNAIEFLPGENKGLLGQFLGVVAVAQQSGHMADQPGAQSIHEDPERLLIPLFGSQNELFVVSMQEPCSLVVCLLYTYRGTWMRFCSQEKETFQEFNSRPANPMCHAHTFRGSATLSLDGTPW